MAPSYGTDGDVRRVMRGGAVARARAGMSARNYTALLCSAAALVLLLAASANHFHNGFHFDDGHSIVENTFVRDIGNIPRFFRDATTFSVLPLNQSYRPVLQATLAIDYWLGGGYRPVVFQIDTFLWFVA